MESKIEQFKNYNFEEMKNWSDEWYIEILSPQKK